MIKDHTLMKATAMRARIRSLVVPTTTAAIVILVVMPILIIVLHLLMRITTIHVMRWWPVMRILTAIAIILMLWIIL